MNMEFSKDNKEKLNKTQDVKQSWEDTITIRLYQVEQRLSGLEDKVKELDHSTEENIKSKKINSRTCRNSRTVWKGQTNEL